MVARLIVAVILAYAATACGSASKDNDEQSDLKDAAQGTDGWSVPECPAGLYPGTGGECAPVTAQCEPFEMPLVGGGCRTVGPRGCPLAWKPAAGDAACQPGDLLSCPEGFEESEDRSWCSPVFAKCGEHELPLLGGLCSFVGPVDGDGASAAARFSTCDPAHPGIAPEGCHPPVGPRACPELWGGEAQEDCVAGDILPCPDGWEESEDGYYCRAVLDVCPSGKRPLTGGGCAGVIPGADECPPGPFPAPPAEAVEVLHVDANSDCAENCGSEDAPWPSISSALATAVEGAAILVAAGDYDEGLLVDKQVSIAGLCASKTALTGSVEMEPVVGEEVTGAGVLVQMTDGVALSGLRVGSKGAGVVLVGAGSAHLEEVEIAGASEVGLLLVDSDLIATGLWVHDTVEGEGKKAKGLGIWVLEGASLELDHSVVDNAIDSAVQATGSEVLVKIRDSALRNTACIGTGVGGNGVRVDGGAQLLLERTLVENTREVAVRLKHPGTSATIVDSVIRDTEPNQLGEFGMGLAALGGSQLLVEGSLIDNSTYMGVAIATVGTSAVLERSVVARTRLDSSNDNGYGLQSYGAASVTLLGTALVGNREAGLVLYDPYTTAEVRGSIIRATEPAGDGYAGYGIACFTGSSVAVVDSVLEENHSTALQVLDDSTEAGLTRSTIRLTAADKSGGGAGIVAGLGGTVEVESSLFWHNVYQGMGTYGAGSHILATDTVVQDTQPSSEGLGGGGCVAEEGGSFELLRCLFRDNSYCGIQASGEGVEVNIEDSSVLSTMADGTGLMGRGIEVLDGAHVQAFRCLLDSNTTTGAAAHLSGSELHLEACAVVGTVANPGGLGGSGLEAYQEALLTVTDSLVQDNVGVAALAVDDGTTMILERSLLTGTQSTPTGELGRGIELRQGATVAATDVVVSDNRYTGIMEYGDGTSLALERVVVRNTTADENGEGGWGLQAASGCDLYMSGVLLAENTEEGVVIFNYSTADIGGVIVRDTLLNSDGERGRGVDLGEGAQADLSHCLVAGNSSVGIAAAHHGTRLTLHGSAVVGTRDGGAWLSQSGRDDEFQKFGDGIWAGDHATVDVVSTVVAGSARTGVFYDAAGGTIMRSLVAGNASFGLALNEADDLVDYSDSHNTIIDNGYALPPAVAANISTSPEGLPPPQMPELDMD